MVICIESAMLLTGLFFLNNKNKTSYFGMLCLTLAISVPALYFIPGNVDDLYKYFVEMSTVKQYGDLHSLFIAYHEIPFLMHHSANYIYDVGQWLISRSGDYSLLPFLSAFIIYTCIMCPFIHQNIKIKYKLRKLIFGLIIVISLFPYCAVISTIRWNLASAIFFLITYITLNCKYHRYWTIPLYIIPIGIHQGMLIPVAIVIFCVAINKFHIKWYTYAIFMFIILLIFYLISHGKSNLSLNFQYYNSYSILSFLGGNRFQIVLGLLSSFVPYIYLLLSIILIQDNNAKIDFHLEESILIFFVIVDLSLFFDLTIANRYALDIGLCSILIYLKTEQQYGNIRPLVKYVFFITSIIYILIIILFIILKMHFDFSQINLNGAFDYINMNQ